MACADNGALGFRSTPLREGRQPCWTLVWVGKPVSIHARFGSKPDKDVFLVGPTGLALGANDTLYVSDATGNRISAIWDAATRDHSAGVDRTVTKDGLLQTPLAMTTAPNGHPSRPRADRPQMIDVFGDRLQRRPRLRKVCRIAADKENGLARLRHRAARSDRSRRGGGGVSSERALSFAALRMPPRWRRFGT